MSGYYTTRSFSAEIAGVTVRVVSKPGIPEPYRIRPPVELLVEYADLPRGARVLVLGCGHGALLAALALRWPGCQVDAADASVIAVEMTRQTLAANQVETVGITTDPLLQPVAFGAYDRVLIDLPRGRRLSRRWLATARGIGCPLLIAGANDEGIQSAIRDAADLFGDAVVVAYRAGCRVAIATRAIGDSRSMKDPEGTADSGSVVGLPSPASMVGSRTSVGHWLQEPGIAPGTWAELEVTLPSGRLKLHSLPGVFSFDRLDEGTRLLLDCLKDLNGLRVLDLGCGWGAIGLHAARSGALQVTMVDSDGLAVASAARNAADLGLSNARALAGDGPAAVVGERFDRILSNPPFHAGKGIDLEMAEAFISHSRDRLGPGGELILVANRFLKYEPLLRRSFGSVDILADDGRYRVMRAQNSGRPGTGDGKRRRNARGMSERTRDDR